MMNFSVNEMIDWNVKTIVYVGIPSAVLAAIVSRRK